MYTYGASQVALVVKNLPANAGDIRDISGLGRSPGGEHGNPLQYSCLENHLDRGAWKAAVHRATKVEQDLSDLARTHARRVSQKPRKVSRRSWSLGRNATELLHR